MLLTIIPQASANILYEATRISSALNGALSSAESLSQIHAEASHSTSQLIKTISLLTETTHFELEKINASSNLLQQELLFVRRDDKKWWQDLFIRIAQNIFYGEPIYLIHNVEKLERHNISRGYFGRIYSPHTSGSVSIFFSDTPVDRISSDLLYLDSGSRSSWLSGA